MSTPGKSREEIAALAAAPAGDWIPPLGKPNPVRVIGGEEGGGDVWEPESASLLGPRHLPSPSHPQANPRVFLDIALGRNPADRVPLGRIVVEVRAEVVPKTADNFAQLAQRAPGLGYPESRFHRVIPGFM